MNVIPFRRSNDLRAYVQGLANRVRDRDVDGVLVIECMDGAPVRQHVAGVHPVAFAGAVVGIAAELMMESLLVPLERRGLNVASTLDFGRRVLGIGALPHKDVSCTPPSTPHDMLSDVLSLDPHASAEGVSRDTYERLNQALWRDPVGVLSATLGQSISPGQWIGLARTNVEAATALAVAIEGGEPDSWADLFVDTGEGPLDRLAPAVSESQARILSHIEEAVRKIVGAVG